MASEDEMRLCLPLPLFVFVFVPLFGFGSVFASVFVSVCVSVFVSLFVLVSVYVFVTIFVFVFCTCMLVPSLAQDRVRSPTLADPIVRHPRAFLSRVFAPPSLLTPLGAPAFCAIPPNLQWLTLVGRGQDRPGEGGRGREFWGGGEVRPLGQY